MENQPNLPQGWTRIPWVMWRDGPESPYADTAEEKNNPMFKIGDILRTPGPAETTTQIVDAMYDMWGWKYLTISPEAKQTSWDLEKDLNVFTFMRDWNTTMTQFLNPDNLVSDISTQARFPPNSTFDLVTNLGTPNRKIKGGFIRRSRLVRVGGDLEDPRQQLREYFISFDGEPSNQTEGFTHYRLMWLLDETERLKARKEAEDSMKLPKHIKRRIGDFIGLKLRF